MSDAPEGPREEGELPRPFAQGCSRESPRRVKERKEEGEGYGSFPAQGLHHQSPEEKEGGGEGSRFGRGMHRKGPSEGKSRSGEGGKEEGGEVGPYPVPASVAGLTSSHEVPGPLRR